MKQGYLVPACKRRVFEVSFNNEHDLIQQAQGCMAIGMAPHFTQKISF